MTEGPEVRDLSFSLSLFVIYFSFVDLKVDAGLCLVCLTIHVRKGC